MKNLYDVIILGSGPAGLTAAIYCQRFGYNTLVVAGRKWGGQLMLTTDVENYPGFPKILGPELMKAMRDHVAVLGIGIVEKDATNLDTGKKPFVVTAEDETFEAKAVIVATGADTKWLGVPGEEKLRGHGVSSCAPCDAFFFRGRPVAVVGGGDSAMEEAHVIAKVSPDVVLIHRREEFRAQKVMVDRVLGLTNVRVLYNTVVVEMLGEDKLTGILLETASVSPKQGVASLDALISKFGGQKQSGNRWMLPREGIFVSVGLTPNTNIFKGLDRDVKGYVKRFEEHDEHGIITYFTKTSVPGVFTAGDVHDARYKQAVTAAGFGCMAALDVELWLTEQT
ncbi:FAD-dependent oxidoreductase [Candidatus Gottesmanbacteria bacterium]|nr:FAD-dependent oxidoreductase [Candidatus Gottesmanbacteria bacterium]